MDIKLTVDLILEVESKEWGENIKAYLGFCLIWSGMPSYCSTKDKLDVIFICLNF